LQQAALNQTITPLKEFHTTNNQAVWFASGACTDRSGCLFIHTVLHADALPSPRSDPLQSIKAKRCPRSTARISWRPFWSVL